MHWLINPAKFILFYFMDCNYDELNIKKNTQHMGWPRPTQIVWPVEDVDQIHEDGTSFGVTWKTGDSSCSHLFYREMGPWSSGRGLEADIQNDFEPTHSIHGLSPTYLVTVGSGGGETSGIGWRTRREGSSEPVVIRGAAQMYGEFCQKKALDFPCHERQWKHDKQC